MEDFLDFKFYLNFKNEDSFGRIEITESVGWDGSSFVIEQESKRYGRDAYKINEEINLKFYKGNFEPSEMQVIPNGTVIFHLTQGYDWLRETIDKWGFEANIDFEVELNGILFIPANLDIQTSESDDLTYLSCKALQQQSKQLIKRREGIETDIFSDEDLDGNPVAPVTTENILVKAKPVVQNSKWNTPKSIDQDLTINPLPDFFYAFNFINGVEKSNIQNTLSYIQGVKNIYNDSDYPQIDDFVYIDALNNLTDGSFTISNVDITISSIGFSSNLNNSSFKFYYYIGSSFSYDDKVLIYSESFNSSQTTFNYSPSDIVINDDIPSGNKLYLWFEFKPNSAIYTQYNLIFNNLSEINATYTSTAIDTVVKGVRYIDVIKANLERVNGYEVFAPRYDVGGEYYDQFAFTGNLIKQRDDVAFSVKFKDLMEDLSELNADYQITDKLYIGQYVDYYPNKEIGVFLTYPDDSFKFTFNQRYAINEFTFKYQTYEQDDSEENTTDAIHTDTQWLTSNLQVENTKEVNIKYIRDAFKLEKTRKDASKDTTSTTDDDKMFLLDVVPLAPSARGGFSALMTHNVNDDGQVQLLKDANLPSWAVLGFGVDGSFFINSDDNNGEYTVAEIENTIITLNPVDPISQTFTGESYTEVEYPFTNVAWVNRTNEWLVFSENLLNADNYANLKYSIKRNLETWKPYIDTALMYKPNGTFKNTYFKDNGDAITRFAWEAENVQENATITKDELTGKVITARLYETRLVAPYEDMVNVINAIDTINADNTIGGFLRCIDNNGKVIKLYPQKLDYVPSTNELTLTGEERFEGSGVDIVVSGDTVTINEVGYDVSVLSSPFYEYDGDYFKIYDINKLPIINPTKYDEITVNGLTFDSSEDLLDYLVNL